MNQSTNPIVSFSGTNRLIAAPKSDAGRFVSDAGFRTDNYFCNRLNVVPVTTAPKDGRQKESVDSFSVDTDPRPLGKSRMQEASFATVANPSTARQLEGPMDFGVLTVSECPPVEATGVDEPCVAGLTMAQIEKLAITQTLQRCSGNRTRAARMLGVSVRTLQRKLNSWK